MSSENKHVIGVIGAGAMGRGIIQLFAQAGHEVRFFDASEEAVAAGHEFVAGMIQRGADKGRMTQEQADSIKNNLIPCPEISDLSSCDIVVEAIIENIDIKQKVFAQLEEVVSEKAILSSNTSSLVVAEIAAKCKHPERVAGLHFFNPVPLMKVAEVISAVKTSSATVATLKSVVEGAGHRAVIAEDQPGFLVNHAGRGLYTEGLRILEERAADQADVDRVMREAAGFRMGPFELLDLTGLDVSGKVMESIYEQFQQEPRFRPSSLVAPRVAAGLYGRKTGEGWYRYEDNQKIDNEEKNIPTLTAGTQVWIDPQATQVPELTALATSAGAEIVDNPTGDALLIIQPWGIDSTQACADANLDASRCVAVDPLPGLDKRRTLMLTPITTEAMRDSALAILASDGAAVTVINDSPGFILQRVLATIVNIATNIAQRGIASVEDIEDAVKLGLGYPNGPLSWGDKIGGERILEILEGMQAVTGDPRYRPSQWLRRRVELNLSLLTPETNRS